MRTAYSHLIWFSLVAICWLPQIATAVERHPGKVPPSQEIEILDPNVESMGRPAVLLRDTPAGTLEVEIPPVVLVHKYYYTGDRTFQAQLLPGGPSVIVANHPKTGHRCYLEVQMPPGAPKVTYTSHAIEYDYGEQGVTIRFPPLLKPKVSYRNGVGIRRRTVHAVKSTGRGISEVVHRSGVPEHMQSVMKGLKNATHTAADGLHTIGETVIGPIHTVAEMTPIGSIFQENPEREALRQRDRQLRTVQRDRRLEEATIPTLR